MTNATFCRCVVVGEEGRGLLTNLGGNDDITNAASLAGALGEKMTTDVGDEQRLFKNSIDPTT